MSGSGSMNLLGGSTLTLSGNNTYSGADDGQCRHPGGERQPGEHRDARQRRHAGRQRHHRRHSSSNGGIAGARQLDRHAHRQRQLQPDAGGIYEVEANAAGQSDRINVGGTATINGGTVQVLAQPGNYGRSTTYTILRATGGVSGTYSGVTSNFAFLTPSLSLRRQRCVPHSGAGQNAFSVRRRARFNQRAVGARARPDLRLGERRLRHGARTPSPASAQRRARRPSMPSAARTMPASATPWCRARSSSCANFANRAGSRSGGGTRVALAEACDVACDATTPALWGAWGGARRRHSAPSPATTMPAPSPTASAASRAASTAGSATASSPASRVGYQTGAPMDRRLRRQKRHRQRAGRALCQLHCRARLYVDARRGLRLLRTTSCGGRSTSPACSRAPPTASAGANQFLGQIEAGWRFASRRRAAATSSRRSRCLQGSSGDAERAHRDRARSRSTSAWRSRPPTRCAPSSAPQLGASIGRSACATSSTAQLRLGWMPRVSPTRRGR